MGFWTLSFEIMICILFIYNLFVNIHRKTWRTLLELISGALFGLTLEYANVYFFGNYIYNSQFILQIGFAPNNIPIVIALAWGIIISAVMSVSDRYKMSNVAKTFFVAFLGLSLDLAMDIVAIRLDGGFWEWFDISLNNKVTFDGVCGVNWGNYYGWFCVLLIFSGLIQLERNLLNDDKKVLLIISIFIKPMLAYLFLYVSYYIPWVLHLVIGNFAVSIIIIVGLCLIYLMWYFIHNKPQIQKAKTFESLFLFAFFYIYYLLAFIIAGVIEEIPWFIIVIIILFVITMLVEFISLDFSVLAKKGNK